VLGREKQVGTRLFNEEALPHELEEGERVVELEIDLRDNDHTSRYVRRSGGLPHLTDDPAWVPAGQDLPKAAAAPKRRILRWPGRGRRNR